VSAAPRLVDGPSPAWVVDDFQEPVPVGFDAFQVPVPVGFDAFQEPAGLAAFQELLDLAPFAGPDFVRGPDRGARDCGAWLATVFPSSQGVSSSTRLEWPP